MILSKEFYIRVSLFKRLWLKRQKKHISKNNRQFSPGAWKNYHSMRTRRIPVLNASKKEIAAFTDVKKLEVICPTNAIKVTANTVLISEKNCIGCHECVKASPEGFFTLSQEKFQNDPGTN